jgi:lysozyme family protein
MKIPTLDELRSEYAKLYTTCSIRDDRKKATRTMATAIVAQRPRYESVVVSSVPWYVIGIIHSLECSLDFQGHLHNGDPLSARTVHVPSGRPPTPAAPPFTWEQSAADALACHGLSKWTDWTITGTLYKLESFNGFGYRSGTGRPIPSPYLWSFSNHYSRGKFGSDGHFDPALVSAQVGGAILLLGLDQAGLIQAPPIQP